MRSFPIIPMITLTLAKHTSSETFVFLYISSPVMFNFLFKSFGFYAWGDFLVAQLNGFVTQKSDQATLSFT